MTSSSSGRKNVNFSPRRMVCVVLAVALSWPPLATEHLKEMYGRLHRTSKTAGTMAIIRSLHLRLGMSKEPRKQCPRTTKIYEASFWLGNQEEVIFLPVSQSLSLVCRPSSPRIERTRWKIILLNPIWKAWMHKQCRVKTLLAHLWKLFSTFSGTWRSLNNLDGILSKNESQTLWHMIVDGIIQSVIKILSQTQDLFVMIVWHASHWTEFPDVTVLSSWRHTSAV